MTKVINKLMENTKKAYKESILIDNTILQDLLLEILTDSKKLQEKFEEKLIDRKEETVGLKKKKRYTYEEVKAITKVQIRLAKDEISLEDARQEILNISNRFPVHNLVQYNKHMKDRFNGIGTYGMAMPSNWAKALLEITNYDSLIIKALREQQKLYKEKDGRINQTLEDLLNGL